jgi:hypothetical protein
MRSRCVIRKVIPVASLLAIVVGSAAMFSPTVGTAQQCDVGLCSCLTGTCFDENCKCKEKEDEEEEEKCSYGPCYCQPRKTLMQWSYGTTFSGGPPSMDEPLVSDRPDFTEASVTVGRGVAQVEMGYTFTLDHSGRERSDEHSFPEMLWRIGMFAEWFEFRISYNYGANDVALSGSPVQPGVHTRVNTLYLGAKIALTPQEAILPEMAIMPQMNLEFGDSEDIPDEALPGVNWLYGWDINDFLSTGGSTQINRSHDELDNYYAEFAQSWTVGYSFTDRLGGYTEWFMFAPAGSRIAKTEHYMDGGFTFLVNNNFQLDIRAGVGLNEAAADFFTGAGTVLRF